ncbi:thiolase family protein [Alphaproteobacteria bacterium]|nr:thiolase family protein [Alphaproteobacteria bacterium]
MTQQTFIYQAKRTPQASLMGDFSKLPAPQLGAVALQAAMVEGKVSPDAIEGVFMGCVLSAGQGQAPARQAAKIAGVPLAVETLLINKVCGSGLRTVMMAQDMIQAGVGDLYLAGGMENMSRAPHLLPTGRTGMKFGHSHIVDHMALDGLEDAYEQGTAMGVFAERTAAKDDISREQQDVFAIASVRRAHEATAAGHFAAEMTPVTLQERGKARLVSTDRLPPLEKLGKIHDLPAVFVKTGTVTAANSSSISDGAAALLVGSETAGKKHQLTPMARIVGAAAHGQEAAWFTTAPVGAIQKLCQKIGWSIGDVDLFEINEAFAVVPLAAMKDLNISHEKVNIWGGACALGHPLGASGARILVTLVHALRATKGKKGIAAICIGGGEALALAVECL